MEKTETYLLPIWVTATGEEPEMLVIALNEHLQEALENAARILTENGGKLDIEWTITKRVKL